MGEGREGLHLGQVVQRMKAAAGEKYGTSFSADDVDLMALEGFLWEAAVEYMRGGMDHDTAMQMAFRRYMLKTRAGVITQVQLVRDDIHMTPDAFNPAEGLIESYKATRRSFRGATTLEDFSENFWTWFVQEKSYCLAAGVDSVRWTVLWHSGDYSKGPGSAPQALTCAVTFTPEELLVSWQSVLQHAKALR